MGADLEQALRESWARLLPDAAHVCEDLLQRWAEPHRHYHDQRHLYSMLVALEFLGAATPEMLAAWFHDAVHEHNPPHDEVSSAALTVELLDGLLATSEIVEVQRLVLLTIDHRPAPEDAAGCKLADADLAILGSSPLRYAESVRDIRLEYATCSDDEFRRGRAEVLQGFLARDPLFHTVAGQERWQGSARRNIGAELATLLQPVPDESGEGQHADTDRETTQHVGQPVVAEIDPTGPDGGADQ